MVVEDALHVAHGLLGGSGHQRFIESEAQQGGGQQSENGEKTFHRHSAFKTSSNKSRQAIVNTTS